MNPENRARSNLKHCQVWPSPTKILLKLPDKFGGTRQSVWSVGTPDVGDGENNYMKFDAGSNAPPGLSVEQDYFFLGYSY